MHCSAMVDLDADPADELVYGAYSGQSSSDGLTGTGQVDIDHVLVSDPITFQGLVFIRSEMWIMMVQTFRKT